MRHVYFCSVLLQGVVFSFPKYITKFFLFDISHLPNICLQFLSIYPYLLSMDIDTVISTISFGYSNMMYLLCACMFYKNCSCKLL